MKPRVLALDFERPTSSASTFTWLEGQGLAKEGAQRAVGGVWSFVNGLGYHDGFIPSALARLGGSEAGQNTGFAVGYAGASWAATGSTGRPRARQA